MQTLKRHFYNSAVWFYRYDKLTYSCYCLWTSSLCCNKGMSCIWINTLLDKVGTIPLSKQLACSSSLC